MDCGPPGSSVHGALQQEYWSGLPCPPPRDLPNTGIEPASLKSPALAGRLYTTSITWEAHNSTSVYLNKKIYLNQILTDIEGDIDNLLQYSRGLSVQFSSVTQSCPTLCDPWTVAYHAPPSMGFSSQEYWSGLPFPSPEDPPNSGIELRSPTL